MGKGENEMVEIIRCEYVRDGFAYSCYSRKSERSWKKKEGDKKARRTAEWRTERKRQCACALHIQTQEVKEYECKLRHKASAGNTHSFLMVVYPRPSCDDPARFKDTLGHRSLGPVPERLQRTTARMHLPIRLSEFLLTIQQTLMDLVELLYSSNWFCCRRYVVWYRHWYRRMCISFRAYLSSKIFCHF